MLCCGCWHDFVHAPAGSRSGLRSSQARLPQVQSEPRGGRVPPRSFVPVVGDLFEPDSEEMHDRGRPMLTSAYLAQVLTRLSDGSTEAAA